MNKSFLIFGLITISSFAPSYAVDLQFATNDQILSELSRRLNGGINPIEGAKAIYTCDSTPSLTVSLYGISGVPSEDKVYIGNQTQCASQVEILTKYKSKISQVTVVAVCDGNGYLYRYSLKPDGKIGNKTQTYMESYNSCFTQASAINGSH